MKMTACCYFLEFIMLFAMLDVVPRFTTQSYHLNVIENSVVTLIFWEMTCIYKD